MTSRLVCLLLLATVTLSIAKHLSSEENSLLQQTCGLNGRYKTLVLNGEETLKYPFAAVVNVKGVLTATVISPRHVLLFNVFEMHKKTGRVTLFNETEIPGDPVSGHVGYCDNEDKEDWVFPEQANDLFQIKFAVEQYGEQAVNKVSRVVVLGGCIMLNTYKPLLLELAEDLTFDQHHGAICIPTYDEKDQVEEEFTVFGMGPKGHNLTSAQYRNTSCTKEASYGDYIFCGSPVNQSKGLCQGDFGGGAIAKIDGRNTLLGIFAEGNIDCKTAPQYHQDPEFIDIRRYVKQICRQTGVCPYVEIVEETTTEGPYVPSWERFTQEPTTKEPWYTEEPTTQIPESPNTVETIIAETFEKMLLNCSANEHRDDQPREVHIHIHLDKDAKLHFD